MSKRFMKNRDTGERKLFDSIAKDYVKKDLYSPSRIARKLRLLQTVWNSGISESSEVLEIGCGAGYASAYLSGKYMNYTGIDFSSELISFAGSAHRVPEVQFKVADLYEFEPGKKFDLIFMIGVLHHMNDIPLALKLCRSFLKPEGVIAVNEPRASNFFIGFLRRVRGKIDSSYSAEQEELKGSELVELFREAGLTEISVIPQGFFSTPFAEVMIRPRFISLPLSWFFCMADRFLEKFFGKMLGKLSWNIIVSGKYPGS